MVFNIFVFQTSSCIEVNIDELKFCYERYRIKPWLSYYSSLNLFIGDWDALNLLIDFLSSMNVIARQ